MQKGLRLKATVYYLFIYIYTVYALKLIKVSKSNIYFQSLVNGQIENLRLREKTYFL